MGHTAGRSAGRALAQCALGRDPEGPSEKGGHSMLPNSEGTLTAKVLTRMCKLGVRCRLVARACQM